MIAAAEAAFAASGLAVPMDEIARAAGVGVGTLYRHFPTKEALFAAIVRDHLERLRDEVEALADAPDAGAVFFSFLDRLVEETANKRDLLEEFGRAGIDATSGVADLKASFNAGLDRLLERAKAAGAVRTDLSGTDLVHLLMGSCLAFSQIAQDDESRRRLTGVVLDGLRHTASAASPGNEPPTG